MPAYRVELHCHCQGDPVDTYLRYTIFEAVDRAKEVGLDALAITWHKKIFDDPKGAAYAREQGLLLIPGIEAEIMGRHVVVCNVAPGDLSESVSWEELRALRARKPEVLVMAPHPFYPHPSCLGSEMQPHADCIDIVEWCKIHVHWLPARVSPNLRAARWAHSHGKPLVACSDAHSLAAIGRNASTVEAEALTLEAVCGALRAGRVTFHRRSMEMAPLVWETSKAIASQPRHIVKWAGLKLATSASRRK